MIDLWRYLETGVIPDGARVKPVVADTAPAEAVV